MTEFAPGNAAGRLAPWATFLLTVSLTFPALGADPQPPRTVVAARQVVVDTAVRTTQHPLRAGATLFADFGALFRSSGIGQTPERLALAMEGPPGPLPTCRTPLDSDALEARLRRATGSELLPGYVHLYPDGAEALAALERQIDQAACRIDVLMYLWDDDPVGWEVASRLAAKAGPRLPVRVLVDGAGNLLQGEPREASASEVNRVVRWLARQPYVRLLRTRDPGLHFDHRKLVVTDGRTAWSGGRNFMARAFLEDHDLSYAVDGPLAAEADAVFEESWRREGGTACSPLPCPPLPSINASARIVESGPLQRQIEHALYDAVTAAGDHLYLENPYFADGVLMLRLAEARRRGVDVRVVLTLNDMSGTIDRANRVTANRLLRAGVRVYIYPGMTHVKAASADGRWAYFGTGNFDPLSLRRNRELGMAVGSGAVIGELEERLFYPDFRPEWELTAPLPVGPVNGLDALLARLFL